MSDIRAILTSISTFIVLGACSTTVDLGCEPNCMPDPVFPMTRSAVLERVAPAWTHFCSVADSPVEESTCRADRLALIESCAQITSVPDIVNSTTELVHVQQELHACVYSR